MEKKPCKQCPFRKKSAPGWLGPYNTPQELLDAAKGAEGVYKCHTNVNTWHENIGLDFEAAHDVASPCIGALIMMRNSCHLPRNRELAELVNGVEKNEEIMTDWETKKHHSVYNFSESRSGLFFEKGGSDE